MNSACLPQYLEIEKEPFRWTCACFDNSSEQWHAAFWRWGRGMEKKSRDSCLNSHQSECRAGMALCRNHTPGSLATHLAYVPVRVVLQNEYMSRTCLVHNLYSHYAHTLHLFHSVVFSLLTWSSLYMISKMRSSWTGLQHINLCSLSRLNENVNPHQGGPC